jgi:uncharacterized protein (DUF305 family)
MTFLQRALTPLAAAAATALALTACGTAQDPAEPEPAPTTEPAVAFNDADVAFAQGMIPHHEQAVEMAGLAESRAGDEVRDLAEEIAAAQGPEIEQMTGLLESWGEAPPEDMEDAGHGDMPGMMSGEEMAELEGAEGGEFDALFLEMMILHHEGAITMAETEIEEGADAEARTLAQDVFDAQQAEIEQMTAMLGGDAASDEESADDEDSGDHGGH